VNKILIKIIASAFLINASSAFADHHLTADASVIIPKEEVDSTLLQGLANIAEGRTVSDIVVRHIDVGEEHLGVSVVQRDKVEIRETETAIAHVDLDEIYYIVAGEGTMITGGNFTNPTETNSSLLGPMLRGEVTGGTHQPVKVGDIAIIPKGMPHGWHEITSDTISYIIFRGDPNKVMQIKNSAE
tara:strand:+ start:765 stop:1322 length:558 start_codon:yes stop_codon:yes gene_type:complete